MSVFGSFRQVFRSVGGLRDWTVMSAPPPPPEPPRPPELTEWTQRAYDRLIAAIGPGAEHLNRSEIRTLVWLAGWDVTDNMVNIIRKARQG